MLFNQLVDGSKESLPHADEERKPQLEWTFALEEYWSELGCGPRIYQVESFLHVFALNWNSVQSRRDENP